MMRNMLRSVYHQVADVPLVGPLARQAAALLRGAPAVQEVAAVTHVTTEMHNTVQEVAAVTRVTTEMHKARYRFVPPSDPGFRWQGDWVPGNDSVMISKRSDARVEWTGSVAGAVLVLVCHPYSGVLRIEAPGHTQVIDNYSWFAFAKAFPLAPTLREGPLGISAIGRNPLARGEEVVLAGLWLPDDGGRGMAAEDPAAFEKLQAQMVDNWMENIRRGGGSVEEVTRLRQAAYLHRWREIAPYARVGSRVLDLGAGFIYDDLLEFLVSQGLDYTAIDIDRRVVESNRANGARFGLGPERFLHGPNTQLKVPDACADLIFASHCIEHSEDLPRTFAELRRASRPGGHIFFAVPTSVDTSSEHIYFFSHSDWIAFTEEHGFEVVNQHIGSTYPETGHDVLIVARMRA
jgi:SAM-dependent methyltransferase